MNENTILKPKKAVLRGQFRAVKAYVKEERTQINKLHFHVQKLEKKQIKPQASIRKEIIKISEQK